MLFLFYFKIQDLKERHLKHKIFIIYLGIKNQSRQMLKKITKLDINFI